MLTLLKNPYVILAALAALTLTYTIGHYNGQAAARAKQERIDRDAQKRIDDLKPLDSRDITERLRRGTF